MSELTPIRVTAWIAYYSDGSAYKIFGSEIEALRHAVDLGMSVKSAEIDVLHGQKGRLTRHDGRD